ncbi:MAG TPA: hypothetical protein VE086_00815 [Chthoniobacterales bacterium]|nr:hypothetical protein [Chthoniobacterales bacterium]
MLVAIGTLFIGVSTALAQEQEGRLMDRLLKPDTSLANPSQNKKFSGARTASFDKPARTKSFYTPQKSVDKTYPEERTFTPQQFAARHFRGGDSAAYITSRSKLTRNDTVIATSAAQAGTRVALESNETNPVHVASASTRPFLDKGKSAKSLQAHNKPLTIEQVRELLNKSK